MKARRRLTELEGCVLGEIWDKGPCTAYALRQEFLRSLNPHWSGSAGAIYPLVRRLHKHGFVRAADHATGRKRSKRYVLTAAGNRELCRWLGPPLENGTIGVPMDPLRTRMLYLQALPGAQQSEFLTSALAGLRQNLEQLTGIGTERAQDEGASQVLVLQGAIAMMQSRIDWLHCHRRTEMIDSRRTSQPELIRGGRLLESVPLRKLRRIEVRARRCALDGGVYSEDVAEVP